MAEPRCDCCDLPVYSCGKSAESQQRAEEQAMRRRLLAHPDWFAAAWPGACATCGEWFTEGTPIRRLVSAIGWQAMCCADRPS